MVCAMPSFFFGARRCPTGRRARVDRRWRAGKADGDCFMCLMKRVRVVLRKTHMFIGELLPICDAFVVVGVIFPAILFSKCAKLRRNGELLHKSPLYVECFFVESGNEWCYNGSDHGGFRTAYALSRAGRGDSLRWVTQRRGRDCLQHRGRMRRRCMHGFPLAAYWRRDVPSSRVGKLV